MKNLVMFLVNIADFDDDESKTSCSRRSSVSLTCFIRWNILDHTNCH